MVFSTDPEFARTLNLVVHGQSLGQKVDIQDELGQFEYIEKLCEVAHAPVSQLEELDQEKADLCNTGEDIKGRENIEVEIASTKKNQDKWHEEK